MPTLRLPIGAALDLRSQLYFHARRHERPGDLIEAVASDNDRLIHESGHWARFNGSSLGVLLTFMRRTRDLAAVRLLRSLTREEHARLVRERLLGTPIMDAGRFVLGDCADPQATHLAQSWLHLYGAYRLLLGTAHEPLSLEPSPAGVLDEALFATWYQSAGRGMLPFDRDGAVDGPSGLVLVEDVPLTTRLLLENAALLDELYPNVIGTLGALRDTTWSRRLGKSAEGDYGLAYDLANKITRRHVDPGTLLAVIDFALNPPVPGLTRGVQRVAFNELYPPIRFVRAVQALTHGPVATDEQWPTSQAVGEVHRVLAARTGMRMGSVDAPLTQTSSLSAVAGMKASLPELIPEMQLMHSRLLLRERREEIVTLSHFGLIFVDEGALRFVRPDRWWVGGNWWLFPPLEVVDGQYRWPADRIDIDQATTLLCASAVSAAFDDIMLGTGPLTTGHLPVHEMGDAAVRDLLTGYVFALTGFELAWDAG